MTPKLLQRMSISALPPEHESYFHYNSGRRLYNEKERECCTSHLKAYDIKLSMQNWLLGMWSSRLMHCDESPQMPLVSNDVSQ
jgi:hypothetical protein